MLVGLVYDNKTCDDVTLGFRIVWFFPVFLMFCWPNKSLIHLPGGTKEDPKADLREGGRLKNKTVLCELKPKMSKKLNPKSKWKRQRKVRGIKLKRNAKLRTNQRTIRNKSETQGTHEDPGNKHRKMWGQKTDETSKSEVTTTTKQTRGWGDGWETMGTGMC